MFIVLVCVVVCSFVVIGVMLFEGGEGWYV